MDDLIYRNNSIAEENIDPHGRPAKNKFERWGEQITDRTQTGYEDQPVLSEEEREKRIKEMEEIVKDDLKGDDL